MIRYSVSYRQRWWSRRRYVMSVVELDEAVRFIEDAVVIGRYRRLRLDVEVTGVSSE